MYNHHLNSPKIPEKWPLLSHVSTNKWLSWDMNLYLSDSQIDAFPLNHTALLPHEAWSILFILITGPDTGKISLIHYHFRLNQSGHSSFWLHVLLRTWKSWLLIPFFILLSAKIKRNSLSASTTSSSLGRIDHFQSSKLHCQMKLQITRKWYGRRLEVR